MSISTLFRGYDVRDGSAQLVKDGEGMEVVRREHQEGHTYHLLATHDQGPPRSSSPSDQHRPRLPRRPSRSSEHPGTEFIYMLEGEIEYRHGQNTYVLKPGDALTFRGDVPPRAEAQQVPIKFLSI